MPGKFSIRDIDRGAAKLLRAVMQHQPSVRVGVFGDAAAQKHGEGTTVGEIATAHEFRIPRSSGGRRWLRTSIDENGEVIALAMRRAAQAVYRGQDPRAVLGQFGAGLAGLAQQRISAGLSPPLDPKYAERKALLYPGADVPLIASGQFRGSITYAVDGMPAPTSGKAGGGGKRKSKTLRKVKRALRAARRTLRNAAKVQRTARRSLARAARQAKRTGKGAARDVLRSQRQLLKRANRAQRRAVREAKRQAKAVVRGVRKAVRGGRRRRRS